MYKQKDIMILISFTTKCLFKEKTENWTIVDMERNTLYS